MTAKEIYKKIKELGRFSADETKFREEAENLFLVIDSSHLNKSEKKSLMTKLCKLVRSVASIDCYEFANEQAEMNALLEELCLAASFFLLEREKSVYLFLSDTSAFVSLNLRSFENCFYFILRRLLKTNPSVSVFVKNSFGSCSLIFRAQSINEIPDGALAGHSFYLYENGQKSLCLKLNKCSDKSCSAADEDFSLLLFDRMSPLSIWLCDI